MANWEIGWGYTGTSTTTDNTTYDGWKIDYQWNIGKELNEYVEKTLKKGDDNMRTLFAVFAVNKETEEIHKVALLIAEDCDEAEKMAYKIAAKEYPKQYDDLIIVVNHIGGKIPDKKEPQEVKIVE